MNRTRQDSTGPNRTEQHKTDGSREYTPKNKNQTHIHDKRNVEITKHEQKKFLQRKN